MIKHIDKSSLCVNVAAPLYCHLCSDRGHCTWLSHTIGSSTTGTLSSLVGFPVLHRELTSITASFSVCVSVCVCFDSNYTWGVEIWQLIKTLCGVTTAASRGSGLKMTLFPLGCQSLLITLDTHTHWCLIKKKTLEQDCLMWLLFSDSVLFYSFRNSHSIHAPLSERDNSK